MSTAFKISVAAFGLVALGACVEESAPMATSAPTVSAPTVGSSTDVTSFEGARAGQAEGGLMNLGYSPIRSEGLTTWWFNASTGACARITTADGRYSDVTMLPAEDC
ncbi:hypothetical protein [Yoonia sediminilitoris]|uniref:Uncharacterized protein n=1 Tax=Yoonia sediminilitoris TaxID=1286148 RepID=A0A2T6K5S8_9RHOB|nr:hypothetical protein [Yoonia sediminilitoris]PUB09969.1 hypothetical protein C8N45_12321 [Yoonia sediminilitoris]RCW89638.1 hypothetical protein DFP92_12321 [Yoonia sediminilitoris]